MSRCCPPRHRKPATTAAACPRRHRQPGPGLTPSLAGGGGGGANPLQPGSLTPRGAAGGVPGDPVPHVPRMPGWAAAPALPERNRGGCRGTAGGAWIHSSCCLWGRCRQHSFQGGSRSSCGAREELRAPTRVTQAPPTAAAARSRPPPPPPPGTGGKLRHRVGREPRHPGHPGWDSDRAKAPSLSLSSPPPPQPGAPLPGAGQARELLPPSPGRGCATQDLNAPKAAPLLSHR